MNNFEIVNKGIIDMHIDVSTIYVVKNGTII